MKQEKPMLKVVVAPEKATDTKHRELSWFSQRVEKGRSEPFVEVVTITPAIAARLLEMNDGNRPVSDRLVDEIAADIEHGYWQLNGETIIVSREGLLNDGQHRLEAVVKTGRPIQSAVMFGVSRDARMTVDMGKQRTAANFLSMGGVSYSPQVASICRAMLLYEKGIFRSAGNPNHYQPTKQEVLNYYSAHKKEIDRSISEVGTHKFPKSCGATAFMISYVILHRKNPVESGVFFARLCDGTNLKATDAILWLRSRFVSLEWRKKSRTEDRVEAILRSWNAWRNGRKITRHIKLDGAYPKVEG